MKKIRSYSMWKRSSNGKSLVIYVRNMDFKI